MQGRAPQGRRGWTRGGTRSRRRAHKAHGARISGGADLASTGWAVSANAQADINPNLYPNRGQQGWEWQAAPGPNKRGAMCVTHTDALRGYGFQSPCPPPKTSPRHAIRR